MRRRRPKIFTQNIQRRATFSIIVAVDEEGGFGKGGKIPWHFPEDFKHFQDTTKGSICIMGRRTYNEILEHAEKRWKKSKAKKKKLELLPGRESIVLSRNPELEVKGATLQPNLQAAIDSLKEDDKRPIFIIGGEKLFTEALPRTDTVYLTVVKGLPYKCDRFFPVHYLKSNFKIDSGTETDKLYFVNYTRTNRVWPS